MQTLAPGHTTAPKKNRSLALAMIMALASGACLAQAQTASPAPAEPTATTTAAATEDKVIELDAFNVTGIRASVITALEQKRAAVNLVDSIVAEDIGKFPDNNVIEALQRLPGVQVTDRASGQIATVTVRGLTDVSTTINGRNVFTASGQALSLQDIPASLLASVDVYKSRSADLIENGIAGQIDIHTHRPFDFSGDRFSLATRLIYADPADKYSPNASALFSKRWSNSAGKFGALINVSYSETAYRNNSITPGAMVPFMTDKPAAGWVPYQRIFTNGTDPWVAGLTDGLSTAPNATMMIGGVATPYVLARDAIFAVDGTGTTKRPAANVALQWAPNKESEYTFEFFYDGYENKNFNNLLFSFVDWWGGPHGKVTLYPGTNIVKSRASTPWVYTFNSGDMGTGKTDSYVLALSGKWDLTPDLKLKADATYQTSEFNSTFFAMRIDRVAPEVSVDFNTGNGLPALSFPGTKLTDPSIWNMANIYDHANRNKGSASTLTTDGTYNTGWSFFKKLKFGLRYDLRDASEAKRLGEAGGIGQPLSNFKELQYVNSNFFDGKANVPTSWVAPNGYYINDNADKIRTLYGRPTSANLKLTEDFNVEETNVAGYLMTNFETYVGGHRLDGQVGARYVHVSTDMNFGTQSGSASVGKLLPSGSMRFNITDNLRLRVAYGETLRRPNFVDINPTITYTKDVTNIGYGTASGGNSNLKPTQSKNYDVALEYFINDASAVFVSAFRRDIQGLVVGFRKHVVYQNYDYVLSQPDNASNGVLKGYEIGGSYFPKNLPGLLDGLGVSASFTALDSEQDIPITDAKTGKVIGTQKTPFFAVSDTSYNCTLAYEKKAFSARLSYEWRTDFLHHYEAALFANPIGVYNRPEQSMDLQLSYQLTKNLTVTLDATNLTNEIYQSYYGNKPGNATTNNFGNNLYSRTIALGARYKF
jgi:TonB-dependent receptor